MSEDIDNKIGSNIYEKMQIIKQKLVNRNLDQTGENSFSKFKYYQLKDIVPSIIELCNEQHLFTKFNFDNEKATLLILDIDYTGENNELKNQFYESPMKEAEIKGANAIQCLGGTETYQRRYLYMMAFDITEGDMFDATLNKNKDEKKSNKTENNKEFLDKEKMIQNYYLKSDAIKKAELLAYLKEKGYSSFAELKEKNKIEDIDKILLDFNISLNINEGK